MTYQEFLKSKELKTIEAGFDVDRDEICPMAFDFQKDLIQWACKKGKAAVLIGCGCGKTIISLSWAELVHKRTGGDILIIAPLSVVEQTKREAEKFHTLPVNICRTQEDVRHGLNITNYEMAEHFDHKSFIGVVLDESSILKSFNSKTTVNFTEWFKNTPYKLLCTATIAPNSYVEIGTSCEFLGIMSRSEMLATYFIHDSGKTSEWRLKKAAKQKFWEWLATWAVYFENPRELGYEIDGYDLPELRMHTIITKSDLKDGELVVVAAETLEERRLARKESMDDRTDKAAELISSDPHTPWLCWVDYNDESSMLHKKIAGSVEVKGSDEPEYKSDASIRFANGNIGCLVSKPSIFGFGSNFQNCHKEIFCGLSDSMERFYQAVRRCWRFGQKDPVDVYIIMSEREMNILDNIKKKQAQMNEMQKQMTALMKEVTLSEIRHTTRITTAYNPRKEMELPSWI